MKTALWLLVAAAPPVVWLLVPAVVLLLLAVLVLVLLKKAERFSRSLFGTKSLAEGLRRQERELSRTPKSVSGMTRIYEPRLLKDFPELNWRELQRRAEQWMLAYFSAISQGKDGLPEDASEALRGQLALRLRENRRRQVRERFEEVVIHDTQIANYERKQGICVLTLQSAVGYIHYREKDGVLLEGDRTLAVQTKYNIPWMYVQDASAANLDRALGATCPSCGAPITGLGAKKCEYCGLAVTPVNVQVWILQGFYEVNYHNV